MEVKEGDEVVINNLNHKYHGQRFIIEKVMSRMVRIYMKDGRKITFNIKKENVSLVSSIEGKYHPIEYYLEKAFPREDFEDIVLVHRVLVPGNEKIKYINLLDLKLNNKEMKGEGCVYFSPLPKKLFAKYYLNETIKHFEDHEFLALKSNVICNLPEGYWIAINCSWLFGPKMFGPAQDLSYVPWCTYMVDSCSGIPDFSGGFRDFFIDKMFGDREKVKLIKILLQKNGEEKLINYLRKEGCERLLSFELFVCTSGWRENKLATLKFSESDILASNYSDKTVSKNIRKIFLSK